MEWRRGGVEEKNEEVRRRGPPWAGAPLLTFFFILFLNFEGGKIVMAHHGQVRH